MASGGKGAVGKIYVETAVVDNFKQIAGQIKSGLGNGLKDLKDLELPFNFREKEFAQAVSAELQEVTRLLGTSKLSKLDYSNIIPTLTDALADDSLTDSIKYQIVQGFRQGLETANEMLTSSNLTAIQQKTGQSADKTLAAIGGYTAIDDIISSFGLNKGDSKLLAKNYNKAAGWIINGNTPDAQKKARKQTAQLMALKDVQDAGYNNVLRYLVDLDSSASQLSESHMMKLAKKEELTVNDAKKIAGILERINYLTENGSDESRAEAQNTLARLNRSDYLSQVLKQIEQNPKLTEAAVGIRDSVRKASELKDTAYQRRNDEMYMDGRHPMTILTEFAERISGMESVYNKIAPLLARDIPEASPFSVDKMFDETIRSMKANQELEAKRILEAESSASRAEDTLKETKEVVEKAEQPVGSSLVDSKTKEAKSAADSTEKVSEEAVSEEKPESSIKTWKDLEKAEREYDKLRDKIVSTWQEVETLDKQINEAQQKADESRIRYKNLEGQQKTKKSEFDSLSERKKEISKRLANNKEELSEVEKELKEIQKKRAELKYELKKYDEETKALYENEAIRNKEANEQRQKEVGNERVELATQINKNEQQLSRLKKRANPEIDAHGRDSALEAFKERAAKMQKYNAEYEKALADYKAGKMEQKDFQIARTQRRFSQVEFLKALQNAKTQGVKGEDLFPFMENAEEKYGFDLKLFKKDKDFRKDADKNIQKALDEPLTLIEKQIEKKEAELQALKKRSEKVTEEAQTLNAKITEANKTIKERESGRTKLQNEINALDKKERSKANTQKRLQANVQRDEEVLSQSRYTSLEENRKKTEESEEAVEKARQEAEDAKKDLEKIQRAHRTKKKELIDMSTSRRNMGRDIEIGQTNLLTEEIETRTAPDASKTKSRKKDVLEKRREDLANKRKQLEEEIKKDNDTLTTSETKQKELTESIEQITNEQESNRQEQAESRFNLQNYDNIAKESEKSLKEAETKLAALRERQQQLIHEKEEFDAETERLMSQKAFKKNTKISNEIHGIENGIQQRKDNLAILTQDAEQMSKALKATPEKRPLALDELKDAARANQKAQDELREIEILLDQGEFKNPEEEQNLRERHKLAKEKSTKAYAAYINAIENATESKTPYNFLEEYTGKKYDPAQMISPENYFMYQQFGTFVLDKSLLEPFKELQNLLDERNKQIEQAQKEIDIQEGKIGELQKKLSKGWQDVNPKERAQQSAEKQAEIDRLTGQEETLKNQQSNAQSNLDKSRKLSQDEQTTLDNLETKGTDLETRLAEEKEKQAKEVEAYKQLEQIRDEKKRRLERVQANEDLLKQAEEEISNRLQDKSKEKPPAQEQRESIEENPIVEQADEEVIDAEELIKAIEERKKELEGKIKELNSLIESFPNEEDYRKFYDTDSAKTYNEPVRAAENPTSAAMKQLRERGSAFKQTIKDIKTQEKEMKSMDKESAEYKKAEENLQRLQDQYVRDWVAMYYAHEEFGGWGVESGLGSKREQQTYNKWVPEKQGDKEHPFSKENLKMMLERIQEQRDRKIELEKELAKYQEELKSLTEEKPQEEVVDEPITPEPAHITESASGQPEAITEETEEITEESDAIVEGLQNEAEVLNEAAEEIHEERERVEQARENYNEEVNNSGQGETQPSTPTTTSQPDTTPQEGGEQVKPEVEVAEKETGEVRKSREDLEKERAKLEKQIQQSTQTIDKAKNQMAEIDRKKQAVSRDLAENEDIRQPAAHGFRQQAQKKKNELEQTEQELKDVTKEREELEEQLRELINAEKVRKNAQAWMNYIDGFTGNVGVGELDRLINIPFTEEGKPQKQKATDELRRIGKLYSEHRTKTGYHADQDNGVWKDAYTVLHYRAMQQAKKHQVADSTLSREEFDTDLEPFYQDSLKKLNEERDFYQGIYNEASETLHQNQEQMERLEKLRVKERDLKETQRQQQKNYTTAQDNADGFNGLEDDIQNKRAQLDQLKQQRDEQQHIYDEAKDILEKRQRQLEELNKLINEAEARESASSATPAISENGNNNGAVPQSGQTGEKSPVVQSIDEQIANVDAQIATLEEQKTDLELRKENLKSNFEDCQKTINEIQTIISNRENPEELIPAEAAQKLRQKAEEYKQLMKEIHQTEKNIKKESQMEGVEEGDEPSREYLTELEEKQTILWNQFYDAYQSAKNVGVNKTTLGANVPEKKGDKVNLFNDQTATYMKDDLEALLVVFQSDLELWDGRYRDISSQYDKISSDIENLNKKKNELRQKMNLHDGEDTKGNLAEPQSPLPTSGTQTADGVQQEGNEADNAASKMKTLADAKKEALEANQQLAESATNTKEAIQNEGNAGDFNTLILALTEIYELLSQLPQLFENFKGFDLTGFTEPLNSLSQVIQQLPKEGFNISLGESFDNLAGRIDEVLQKIQELTSQAKTAEIESNIAEEYDGQIKQLNEQINQLKADAEEAKKALEELKKVKQDAEQITPITKEKKQTDPLSQIDKQLTKEYDNLHHAQDKLFTTTNVSEYNSALENVENTLQRIRQLEQDIVSQYAGQSQTDYLLMGYGDDPIDTLSNRMPESTKARNEAQSSTRQLAKEYIEQQKAEIEALVDSLKTINIIPEDTQSNWGKKRREEYAQITEGAQAASQAIDILNASLESMETSGANPAILKNFLELKESTAQMVKDVQDKNNVFGDNVETASTKLLERLSNVEERLQVIKRDSGKLINIDPALAGALTTIEKHLNKIHDLKNTVSKDPLQAINPQFTRSTNSYLAQMEGKGKSKSVVEGLEQTSARSQADFKRMTTNYGSYATALKKLFDDMSKGAGVSLKQLEEDLKRVNELATKLANSTGLERDNLLTGELNPKADPKVADAQAGAANKVAIAYESMFTKIESEARTAQSTIEGIFGTEGIAQGLDARFVEGSVEGFNDFVQNANQAGEALKRLKEIQENIGNDKNWVTQEENVKEYQQTVKTLNESLKQVAENASKFSVTDELDVQKLRASTTQFIKDNPALSGGDVSQLEGYIDQLQGKINSVDFTAIKNGIESVKQTAIEAGRTGDTFFSMLTQRFKSLGAYLLSFVSFYEVIGVFKQGINIVHELDDALTEMQKVSDESLSSLREYQKGTFDTADKIGTTAAQLQQSTADWMRLGEDLQTASQSAQTANVLFNVSEFDNINDATTALVAMSAAYADAEKDIDKMDIVDRLNLIGNNYAIATDELATALQDGAATLQTAGKQHCQNL